MIGLRIKILDYGIRYGQKILYRSADTNHTVSRRSPESTKFNINLTNNKKNVMPPSDDHIKGKEDFQNYYYDTRLVLGDAYPSYDELLLYLIY